MQLDYGYTTKVDQDKRTVRIISGGWRDSERSGLLADVVDVLTKETYRGEVQAGFETNMMVSRTIYPGSESAAEEGRTTYGPVTIKFELFDDLVTFKLRHL